MSDNSENNEIAALMEHKKKEKQEEEEEALKHAGEMLREEMRRQEEEIQILREKQEQRKRIREEETKRLEELRKAEEQRRKEEEAERRKIKEEAEAKIRQEKERKQKEKEERAKNLGKKNFVIKKAEKSSLDKYNTSQTTVEMSKTKEELDEERRHVLSQRIVPLNLSGLDVNGLIAKAKELHETLYKLESEKYDQEDRFKRQQYDMMELAERARQMNKGSGHSGQNEIAEEKVGPCPFDRLSDKYSNAPPRVMVASKYERNLDRRNFFEKMGAFEKEWLGGEGIDFEAEM